MDDASGQSGYYREIARAFLERRGGAFFLSAKDQAAMAAWEARRVPLAAVLEGIARTFDGLVARGRGTKAVSLAFCDRQVEAAFAQHRERAAGRRKAPPAIKQPDTTGKARREIAKAIEALSPGDAALRGLLGEALEALSAPRPDDAALDRIEAAIEEALWTGATAEDKARGETKGPGQRGGRTPAALEDAFRRRVVMAARARRRIPHVALHYY